MLRDQQPSACCWIPGTATLLACLLAAWHCTAVQAAAAAAAAFWLPCCCCNRGDPAMGNCCLWLLCSYNLCQRLLRVTPSARHAACCRRCCCCCCSSTAAAPCWFPQLLCASLPLAPAPAVRPIASKYTGILVLHPPALLPRAPSCGTRAWSGHHSRTACGRNAACLQTGSDGGSAA